jgi:hypothetical protein
MAQIAKHSGVLLYRLVRRHLLPSGANEMALVHRVTVFKIDSQADQERLLDMYQQMPGKALKVYTTALRVL